MHFPHFPTDRKHVLSLYRLRQTLHLPRLHNHMPQWLCQTAVARNSSVPIRTNREPNMDSCLSVCYRMSQLSDSILAHGSSRLWLQEMLLPRSNCSILCSAMTELYPGSPCRYTYRLYPRYWLIHLCLLCCQEAVRLRPLFLHPKGCSL